MAPQTIQIRHKRLGRPKTRDTEITTLNLDKKVLKHLREMSIRYGMPMNHIIEHLVLSAIKEDHPLRIAEENSRLKEQIREYENRIRKLELELEKMRAKYEGDNGEVELREIVTLREKAHRILDKEGDLKVFELVMRLFNVQPGERLHYLTKKFIQDYFTSNREKELVSRELELKIVKNPNTNIPGWIRQETLSFRIFCYLFFTHC